MAYLFLVYANLWRMECVFGSMEGDGRSFTEIYRPHVSYIPVPCKSCRVSQVLPITSARQLMRTVEDLGHLTQLQKAGVSITGVAAHPARFECVEPYDSFSLQERHVIEETRFSSSEVSSMKCI